MPKNSQKNIYTGIVEKNVWGGLGFLKKNNCAVFIKGAIEGQIIEYQITKQKKNYQEAILTKVISPSSLEIPKEEQKNLLPGCGYQNIRYEEQLRIKKDQLKEIFRNTPEAKIYDILPSPENTRYRNKIEFSCGFEKTHSEIENGRKVWKNSGVALGFHPPQSWSDVVSIPDIFIAPKVFEILREHIELFLKNLIQNNVSQGETIAPWNPVLNKGFWRGVILRESVFSKSITVNIIVSTPKENSFWKEFLDTVLEIPLPEGKKISGILQTVHTGKSDAIINPQVSTLWGEANIKEQLGDKIFEISPFSFFQTNTKGAEILYSEVLKKLGNTKGKKVLDLFCGTGSIGIFCAPNAEKVVGIEMIEEAVTMAKKNALNNTIENAEFYAGKVEKILPEILEKEKFDTIIIDPPRSGMHPKVLQLLAQLPIQKMIYISCNPSTLERDAKALSQTQDWRLQEIQGVDMFPHTPHLEVVSVLERVPRSE